MNKFSLFKFFEEEKKCQSIFQAQVLATNFIDLNLRKISCQKYLSNYFNIF